MKEKREKTKEDKGEKREKGWKRGFKKEKEKIEKQK